MNLSDFTPALATLQTALVSTPDLAANIAEAQAAGDLAYAEAEGLDLPLEDRTDAYHAEFTATMRALGSPMPCPCGLCTAAGAALLLSVITVEEELARR